MNQRKPSKIQKNFFDLNFSRSIKKDFKLLESAVKINNQIRSLYKDLDEREKDQNVNYNFED